jgi:serpin B
MFPSGRLLPAIFVLLAVSPSCNGGEGSGPDPFVERRIPADLAEDVSVVVDAANRFTIDLFRELGGAKTGNLFASPFSVSTALSMAYAGAAGATREEMAAVLFFPEAVENIHPSYGALIESLNRGSVLGGYRLSVADRLWGEQGFSFRQAFLDICSDDYQAGFETLDFTTDPEACRRAINLWVEEKTERKIQDLLGPGSISNLTRLVLTNAIYFKGRWEDPFESRATSEAEFRLADGNSVQVPLMFQEGTFGYARSGELSILEMAYEGGDLSMIILLPDAFDRLADLEAALSHENLLSWTNALHEQTVRVHLPRFGFTTAFTLNDPLSRMGMPSAFDPERADFTGITENRGLFIQAVVHKAFVKTNEEGTEAAAATGITMGVTSVPDYPVFRADHPFLFLIRDRVTGAFLFIGRVADPSSEE